MQSAELSSQIIGGINVALGGCYFLPGPLLLSQL